MTDTSNTLSTELNTINTTEFTPEELVNLAKQDFIKKEYDKNEKIQEQIAEAEEKLKALEKEAIEKSLEQLTNGTFESDFVTKAIALLVKRYRQEIEGAKERVKKGYLNPFKETIYISFNLLEDVDDEFIIDLTSGHKKEKKEIDDCSLNIVKLKKKAKDVVDKIRYYHSQQFQDVIRAEITKAKLSAKGKTQTVAEIALAAIESSKKSLTLGTTE